MTTLDRSQHADEQQAKLALQRQWPQLGRALFSLESALSAPTGADAHNGPLAEQDRAERQAHIRDTIIAQLYRDEEEHTLDARYRALLLVKQGRAAEIVGNPYYVHNDGTRQELPYTGLEGYYVGSQLTPEHIGMTPEGIIQEEANIGAAVLGTLKQNSIDHYTWSHYSKLKTALAGGEADINDLRSLGLLWAEIVHRLHVRVYNNNEFETTITEQIEQTEKLLSSASTRTQEEKQYKRLAQTELQRLKKQYLALSEEAKAKERQERRESERIRQARLAEYYAFREETYALLTKSGDDRYSIDVQDANWQHANITEKISLPQIPDRATYQPIEVTLTPQQLQGYCFLAELGNIGGDPLTRSVLVSD